MEALDIYTLNTTPAGQAMLPPQAAVQGGGGIGGGAQYTQYSLQRFF